MPVDCNIFNGRLSIGTRPVQKPIGLSDYSLYVLSAKIWWPAKTPAGTGPISGQQDINSTESHRLPTYHLPIYT